MHKIKYLLSLFFVFISSCNDNSKNILQQDIDLVDSLKKHNNSKYIESLDSLLKKPHLNDATIALLNLKKGIVLTQLQRDNEALKNLNSALFLFKKINNKEYIAKTYWHLGSSNAFLSNIFLANKQLLLALQYNKETKDRQTEANIYGSLAHTHYLYKDFTTSINYAKKTINIYQTLNDTLGLSSAYNNLAIIYKNTGALEYALDYNTKSLELNLIQSDSIGIAKSHNNIGVVMQLLNKDEVAIEHFKIAIELNKTLELFNSSPFQNLGNLHLENNNLEKAKTFYSQALNIENKKNHIPDIISLNKKLLLIASERVDFKRTLFFQKKIDSLNKIQTHKDIQEKIAILENQYQLSASQQDLKLTQQINKKNKVIFLIILILLILIVLYWFQYEKNKKIKVEKEKIQLEQRVLRSQMNPHFIFNALSSIQNSLMDNDPIKSATYLSTFAKLIRQNFDFINKKSITLEEEINALENYIKTQQMRLVNQFNYSINIQQNINISDTEIPPLLLQPFIENSIEHGFKNTDKKGSLTLNISKDNEHIFYEIIDNGKGVTKNNNDGKTHSIDIFIKRLKLIGNKDEKTFFMNSSESGTIIKFSLKQ